MCPSPRQASRPPKRPPRWRPRRCSLPSRFGQDLADRGHRPLSCTAGSEVASADATRRRGTPRTGAAHRGKPQQDARTHRASSVRQQRRALGPLPRGGSRRRRPLLEGGAVQRNTRALLLPLPLAARLEPMAKPIARAVRTAPLAARPPRTADIAWSLGRPKRTEPRRPQWLTRARAHGRLPGRVRGA